MPTNKNAQLRYQVLDRCFGGADIKFMRDSDGYNAPIKTHKTCDSYRGMIWCYRYDIPDFSIFNNELSEKDIADLQSVIDMLERYRGIPAYQWVEEIVSNLKYRFGFNTSNECLISFDQNENVHGLQYLPDIIDATFYRQRNKASDNSIFAYRPDVEVLEPQWYRDYFKGEVEKIFKKYFEVGR